MKKPEDSQIIDSLSESQDLHFDIGDINSSWGSYTKANKWGSGKVLTGRAIREWIQTKINSLSNNLNSIFQNIQVISSQNDTIVTHEIKKGETSICSFTTYAPAPPVTLNNEIYFYQSDSPLDNFASIPGNADNISSLPASLTVTRKFNKKYCYLFLKNSWELASAVTQNNETITSNFEDKGDGVIGISFDIQPDLNVTLKFKRK